ncbi:MAG: chaperone modulator CbpM [Parasulfuritortus sp.]|nr:chaperone modulator CbpM [Parasulfuritortus sp.]
MTNTNLQLIRGAIVEEEIHLTLEELCQACRASEEHVMAWVFEGVLEPIGDAPPDWRFTGSALHRARLALWLTRDLEINPPGVALALDLLDEIAALKTRLQRAGSR